MNSIVTTLRHTVDKLSEEDALEALTAIEQIKQRSAFLLRFSNHPAIKVPAGGIQPFQTIEPINSAGQLAAELLLEDRR